MKSIKIKVVSSELTPFYQIIGIPKSLDKQVSSFLEFYITKGLSTMTVRAYAFDLMIFFRFYKGKLKAFPAIKDMDDKTLINFILKERERQSSPSSINRRLNTLDLFYRFCFGKNIPGTDKLEQTNHHTKRYISHDSKLGIFPIYAKNKNPFRVKVPHKLVEALRPQEVEQFLATLNSHRNKAIVILMLICGLRSGEVLDLKKSNIDKLAKTIRVRGKGNKERVVPLPDIVLILIENYLEKERPIPLQKEDKDFVFLNQKGARRGKPMTRDGLRSIFRYNRTLSSVKKANPHKFRHTFGKNMATSSVTLPVLKKLLGHNDYRTTLKYINLTLSDIYDDFAKAQSELAKTYGKPT